MAHLNIVMFQMKKIIYIYDIIINYQNKQVAICENILPYLSFLNSFFPLS